MLFKPLGLFEVEAGYRFGDLRDPDFSVRGGNGGYITIGAGLDTRTLRAVRSLWDKPE